MVETVEAALARLATDGNKCFDLRSEIRTVRWAGAASSWCCCRCIESTSGLIQPPCALTLPLFYTAKQMTVELANPLLVGVTDLDV